MQSTLRIAVPLPVKGTYTYAVPEKLLDKAMIGCRALVPFKNRQVTGYILEKAGQPEDQSLRAIIGLLDKEPLFHSDMVPFFEWVADYYIHPVGQVIQSLLPGGLNMNPYKAATLTERGRAFLESPACGPDDKLILSWVSKNPGKRFPWPGGKVYALQRKGWLSVEVRTAKRRTGPLLRKFVGAKGGLDLLKVLELEKGRRASAPQKEKEFLEMIFEGGPLLASELSAKFANGTYLIRKWVSKGVLEDFTGPVYRNPFGKVLFPCPVAPELYAQQKSALAKIQASLDKREFSCFLLHGVTGSGKTEVYYKAVEQAIHSGRKAVLMVPEIALVVYMEGIFRTRLRDRVAIYHSGLSEGERYDQWMRMARGEVDVVIGARSALFSPLEGLGLIIVDEEHDSAYKQEGNPRYNARDAAAVRAKMSKAVLLLGSGTPSVQSFHNCLEERYHLLSMQDRVEKRPLPDVEIVDMKTLEEAGPENEMLSPRLREALKGNLAAGNQSILFLNRRGFHRLYLCKACGQTISCPNCDVALTYHLKPDTLTCHYCGFVSKPEGKCQSCGEEGLKAYGFGTEKLERELREDFPGARVARMDTDSTRKKGRAFQILKKFGGHEIDILVGTQMITKGYDFPMVTLVGVIAADLSLTFPDFRAGERTFQILSQVAGRAGRGDQHGKVIIQTFNPEHYAIKAATTHDYRAFFEKEKQLREQLGYPPFSRLACLRLQGNDKAKTAQMAENLCEGIRSVLKKWPKRGQDIQVLGPVEAPIARMKGKYRWQVLVKSKTSALLTHLLTKIEAISRSTLKNSGVQLILDVDPYHMI